MLVILKCWLFLNLLYLKCFCSNVFRLAFWHTYVYIYILGPGLGAGPHCEHRPHQVPELDLVWPSFCGPAVAPECVARVISGDGFGVWWMHGAPRGSAATLSYMVWVPWGLAGASTALLSRCLSDRVTRNAWHMGLCVVLLWDNSWFPKLSPDFWLGLHFCVKDAILPVVGLLRWGGAVIRSPHLRRGSSVACRAAS